MSREMMFNIYVAVINFALESREELKVRSMQSHKYLRVIAKMAGDYC